MQIFYQAPDRRYLEILIRDLREVLAQPDGRACADCRLACSRCTPQSCSCACRLNCPDLASRLSSDPERFPIEPGILPLVHALSELPLLSSCWSCEGHRDAEGALHRLPSVWFSSQSLVHPRLMAELFTQLKAKGILQHNWQVAAVDSGSALDCVFSIEPRLDGEDASLEVLHADIKALSRGLKNSLHSLALRHIARLDAELAAAA